MTFLLLFATTHLCKQEFLALTFIKTKARNQGVGITLSIIQPSLEGIIRKKFQFHHSD